MELTPYGVFSGVPLLKWTAEQPAAFLIVLPPFVLPALTASAFDSR